MSDVSNKLQDVISDDLFPNVQHVSDVKQVLEFFKPVAQPMRQEQIRAILYLESLGNNRIMHPGGNPYLKLIEQVIDHREKIADPDVFLDVIGELIPKPPKPILMNDKGEFKKIQPAGK
jgi:hypothetical protein